MFVFLVASLRMIIYTSIHQMAHKKQLMDGENVRKIYKGIFESVLEDMYRCVWGNRMRWVVERVFQEERRVGAKVVGIRHDEAFRRTAEKHFKEKCM